MPVLGRGSCRPNGAGRSATGTSDDDCGRHQKRGCSLSNNPRLRQLPIAGVFQNRLAGHNETAGFLGSDPTVFYVNDTIQLSKLAVADWPSYLFWGALQSPLPAKLPAALVGYNTYTSKGLPPGPICTPTVDSIDAALAPDTAGGYLYFLATKDGTTVFAKTKAEHQANIARYGS